ncbi:hypothetical protein C8Q79DRAFT_985891 [Trametes meyenii]|nr:hypothetical protein C8Q79DRAFT_985891 [Trametes meyenii]
MGDILRESLHPTPQRHQGHAAASTALWGHLLRKTGSSQVPSSSAASSTTLGHHAPAISPFDKASASTRILLHDTQAHLERFTERVTHLTNSLDDAKRELVVVQKLYQDNHEQVVDRMIGLTNRCQTALQKVIGTPAQNVDIREITREMAALSNKLESLDKKIDALSTFNQIQSQALQTINDQQGQILSALVPIPSLLQAVPLHIDNTRNQIQESVLQLRQEVMYKEFTSARLHTTHKRSAPYQSSRARPSSLAVPGGSPYTEPCGKKRRLEAASDVSGNLLTLKAAQWMVTSRNTLEAMSGLSSVERDVVTAAPPVQSSVVRTSSSPTEAQYALSGSQRDQAVRASAIDDVPSMASSPRPRTSKTPLVVTNFSPLSRTPLPGAREGSDILATPTSGTAGLSLTTPTGPTCSSLHTLLCPPGNHGRSSNQMNELPSSPAFRDPTPTTPMDRVARIPLKRPLRILRSYMHQNSMLSASADKETRESVGGMPNALLPTTIDDVPGVSMPLPGSGKPMSLKARRALVEDGQHNEGKRFIPLDDEEDENADLLL